MKTKNIFSVLFAALMTIVAFSSCQDNEDYYVQDSCSHRQDVGESMTLSGQWTGNFGMYYNYTQYGYTQRFDSYYTDIVFYPYQAGKTSGWGREVDWYSNGYYKSIQHKFYWNIVDGVLYLNYPSDSNLNCIIRDYYMSDYSFTGYFSSSSSRFSMSKISDYYNWSYYTSDYCTESNTLYTRGGGLAVDNQEEEPSIVCGNYFMDEAK